MSLDRSATVPKIDARRRSNTFSRRISHYSTFASNTGVSVNVDMMHDVEFMESAPTSSQSSLELKEPIKTKKVQFMRIVVVFAMCSVSAALGSVAYFFLYNAELAVFRSQLDGSNNLIAKTMQSGIDAKVKAGSAMATYFSSAVNSSHIIWPFVTLPEFLSVFENVATVTNIRSFSWIPYLANTTIRKQWEQYAVDHINLLEVPVNASTNDYLIGAQGAWKVTRGLFAQYSNETRYPDPPTAILSRYPYASWPIWQIFPRSYWFNVMYDIHSEANRARALDLLLQYQAPQMTDIIQSVGDNINTVGFRPSTLIFIPVLSDGAVVGAISTVFTWDLVLSQILPKYIQGLDCVLKCTSSSLGINSIYTFTLSDGVATLKGKGDLHDNKYDSYATTTFAQLNDENGNQPSQSQQLQNEGAVTYSITVYPTDEFANQYLTTLPVYAVVLVVAAVLLTAFLFLGYDFLVQRRENKVLTYVAKTKAITHEHIAGKRLLEASLKKLPIHKAIHNGESDDTILDLIATEDLACLRERDAAGLSVIDLAIDRLASNEVTLALMRRLLPIDPNTGAIDQANTLVYAWTTLVQYDEYEEVVRSILEDCCNYASLLANTLDENGRAAINIASTICQQAIKESLYFMKRYEIKEYSRPHHKSATCSVYLARDDTVTTAGTGSGKRSIIMGGPSKKIQERSSKLKANATSISNIDSMEVLESRPSLANSSTSKILDSGRSESSENSRVAVKFMSSKSHFTRELETRKANNLSSDMVINIIASFSADEDLLFARELDRHALQEYRYCVVMPAADKNLAIINLTEHFVANDWVQIRSLFTQLATCLDHLHDRQLIHGDVKPANIVRKGTRYLLIDLDASAAIGTGYSGIKYSSGYVPPELIYIDAVTGAPGIKTFILADDGVTAVYDHTKYTLVAADPAHDAWSLGMVFYELCTGRRLNLCDNDDNVTPDGLLDTFHFTPEFKKKKLSVVTNVLARNLLSQLLSKDPKKRPLMRNVLRHPFVTGHRAIRLAEDPAEYDVFISYRVASDASFAQRFFDQFTAAGLRVFLDVKSLQPGISWENGFCDGLVKSRVFLPILSRPAINHPTEDRQSFAKLTENSPCDNCLLEHHLAVELLERGLVEKIYPVMLGDDNYHGASAGSGAAGNYFSDGCHPKLVGKVIVSAEVEKLEAQLERLCLGSPLLQDKMSVADVLGIVIAMQGKVVKGVLEDTGILEILNDVMAMLKQNP